MVVSTFSLTGLLASMNHNEQTFTFEEMAELERRRLVADSLRGTLAVLNSNLSLEKLLNYIVNQACPLLNADAAAIYHLQLNGVLTTQALVGLSSDYVQYANIPLGKLATGKAALSRQPIYFADTKQLLQDNVDPNLRDAIEILTRTFKSILSVPIEIRDENYGSLTLYYKENHDISDEEIALAKDFSIQAALAIDNARLRMRVQQDAIVEERNRLARELHDSVTQNLFSASLIAETLPKLIARDPEKTLEGLNELCLLTRGALAEMRSLLLELRPHAMEDVQLDILIRQLSESASGRLRKPVHFSVSGQAMLPMDVRLTFYRVTQEALNNIIKHAAANCVQISLNYGESKMDGTCDWVQLSIEDDGCGFKKMDEKASHLGFSIMKERAQALGAELTIKSQVNCGTQIVLVWKANRQEQL